MFTIQRSDINFCLFIIEYTNRNNINFKEFCKKLGYNEIDMKHIISLTYSFSKKDVEKVSKITRIPLEMLEISIYDFECFKQEHEMGLEQFVNMLQYVLRYILCDKNQFKEALNYLSNEVENLEEKFMDYGVEILKKGV